MRTLMTLCLAALLMGCHIGCGPISGSTTQPAVDPLMIANQQLTIATNALTEAHAMGLISDADWQKAYLPVINGLSAALDGWQNAQGNNVTKAEAAFESALPDLLQLVLNAQAKKKAVTPTTKGAIHVGSGNHRVDWILDTGGAGCCTRHRRPWAAAWSRPIWHGSAS